MGESAWHPTTEGFSNPEVNRGSISLLRFTCTSEPKMGQISIARAKTSITGKRSLKKTKSNPHLPSQDRARSQCTGLTEVGVEEIKDKINNKPSS